MPARAVVALASVAALGTGGALLLLDDGSPPSRTVFTLPQQSAPVRPPVAASLPVPVLPVFDIVHVAPGGSAVIAGRAEPGASVTVMDAGKPLGTALADARGAWVMIPAAPLLPGATVLSLVARSPSGIEIAGEATVLLVVPPQAGDRAGAKPGGTLAPLAVLAPAAGPSRLLQAPEASKPGKLGLDTVDYDDNGGIRFSGTAPASVGLRLYVDSRAVGDATADTTGHWSMSPGQAVAPGVHRLRLDQLNAMGHVASRIELPFLRETLALSQVGPGEIVVQPQQNLWRLARRAYGSGVRYTVIYQANRDQIRDPRLIYPGQVFSVPTEP